MCASEHKALLLVRDIGATVQRNMIEKVITIRIGNKEQRFWMDSWSVALVWLRNQKRGGMSARHRSRPHRRGKPAQG